MATRLHFSEKLNALQATLVEMGTKTIKAIENSIVAFIDKDVDLSQRIIDDDLKMNETETLIYNSSALLIAEEQPVARDLRTILNAIRASHVFERIADSAVHIAKSTIILENKGYVKPLVDIPRMAKTVITMLKDAVDSYSTYNTDAALEIAKRDSEVDAIYKEVFKQLLTCMHEDPSNIDTCMTLLFICRRLERIGDQTTHICEGVIYVANGENLDLNN
jgi:phosphate transport system protein